METKTLNNRYEAPVMMESCMTVSSSILAASAGEEFTGTAPHSEAGSVSSYSTGSTNGWF